MLGGINNMLLSLHIACFFLFKVKPLQRQNQRHYVDHVFNFPEIKYAITFYSADILENRFWRISLLVST